MWELHEFIAIRLYSAINSSIKVSQAPHPEQAPVFLDIPSRLAMLLSISSLIFSSVVPLQ